MLSKVVLQSSVVGFAGFVIKCCKCVSEHSCGVASVPLHCECIVEQLSVVELQAIEWICDGVAQPSGVSSVL